MDNNDEDEYLYGSEPASKKQKTEEVPEADVSSSKASVEPEKKESEHDEESEYEDDSDDESIEFIINSKPGEKAEAPQQQGPYSNVAPTTMAGTDKVSVALAGKSLDIDQIAEYNGKPITSYSLESFEDKPWRKPGADITDYFNYGFDEVTWSAYCSKQDKLSDFTPQKVMSMLGMGAMEMAMMGAPPMMPGMPAFPGMPGFPPPSQPGMNNNMFGGPPPPGFDGGAYGGSNVQGVAGMIANPHPGGFNGPNNTNNGSGGFNNNGGNRNFQPRNNFQQNSNNNNNNNNWNRNRR